MSRNTHRNDTADNGSDQKTDTADTPVHAEKKDASEFVEVIFKHNRRVIYQNSRNLELTPGAHVIVEADKGEDLGRIGLQTSDLAERCRGRLLTILRFAKEHEIKKRVKLVQKENNAYQDFRQRIMRRQMPMKAVDVEYQLDGKKIRFYFTADHRVDFRQLVRELASVYRTRIELRQIGVRDQARKIGGIGPCGRELCCSTFMSEFAPISSQMARDQNLSLNPTKLSGLCGRLKCCLGYEHDFYEYAQSIYPKVGTRVKINGAEGCVSSIDYLNEQIIIKLDNGDEITHSVNYTHDLPVIR